MISISLRGEEVEGMWGVVEPIGLELANRFRREEVSLICLTRWRRGQEAVASELVSQGSGPFAVELL